MFLHILIAILFIVAAIVLFDILCAMSDGIIGGEDFPICRSIARFMHSHWQRIRIYLPFRMALGKLGILLTKVGRFLQVRYANWNCEFRLKFEPGHMFDDHHGVFHVSERLTDRPELSFFGPTHQQEKQTPLVKDLYGIRGVDSVVFHQYSISMDIGKVFSWDELRPEIERVILKNLTNGSQAAA